MLLDMIFVTCVNMMLLSGTNEANTLEDLIN